MSLFCKTPTFWGKRNFFSYLLAPIGYLYQQGTYFRQFIKKPYKIPIPVICVGNINVGGVGKTPLSIAIAEHLIEQCFSPHFITRGYGRKIQGNFRVGRYNNSKGVGDESLLLSKIAPVWVATSRVNAALLALEQGATHLILDDGFQDPSLFKDLSLCVVDGQIGFGNGFGLPAGPLRENVQDGLKRADALCIMGNMTQDIQKKLVDPLPIFEMNLIIDVPEILKDKKLIAFAGIGYPEKFFQSLKNEGLNVIYTFSYPDHYEYTLNDLQIMYDRAKDEGATLVTTEKDFARFENRYFEEKNDTIVPIKARINIKQDAQFKEMLNKVLS
ncbi:MAG: tetraacyldisaccharide 4'-kinase [Alphaproteobacteria bacterium]|nr:tetraacyldisaccharide 4'-kinase [Alphaproteobacteria bacterium]